MSPRHIEPGSSHNAYGGGSSGSQEQNVNHIIIDEEISPPQHDAEGPVLSTVRKASIYFAAATLTLNAVPKLLDIALEETTTASGGQLLTEVRVLPTTDVIFEQQSTAVGRSEDDSPGPLKNPYANDFMLPMGELKVQTQYPTGTKVVHNLDLAEKLPEYEYAVIVSTYDAEGNDMGLVPSNIKYEPLNPEYCWPGNDDAQGRRTFEGCLDPTDEDYHGAAFRYGRDGGWINTDGTIAMKSNAVASNMGGNNYCILTAIFGSRAWNAWDSENYSWKLPYDHKSVENEWIYLAVMNAYRANLRINAAYQYGIPLTHVFFTNEYQYLVDNPDEFVNEPEWRGIGGSLSLDDPELEINSRIIPKIKDLPALKEVDTLRSQIKDIDYDDLFPNITPDPSDDSRNISICMPGSLEAAASLDEFAKIVDTYSIPPWNFGRGDFGDGVVDVELAKARVAGLAGYM
jgi:hypothetical protein